MPDNTAAGEWTVPMFVQMLQNAALIALSAIGLHLIWQKRELADTYRGAVLIGLTFGIVTLLVTITPIALPDGATIDARAGPVIVAGIVGGPVSTAVAAAFGSTGRAMVGGSFALPAVFALLLYGIAGAALWHRNFRGSLGHMFGPRRIIAGIGLSLVAAALMYYVIQPQDLAERWLRHDLPLIWIANILAVGLTGYVAKLAIHSAESRVELEKTLQTLTLAKKSGRIGIWTFDPRSGVVEWDDVNKEMHQISVAGYRGRFEDWARVVHPEDLPRVSLEFEEALKGNREFDTTYRVCAADGTIHHLKGTAIVLRNGSGAPYRVVGANLDLTPIVEKDRELAHNRDIAEQAQKLDAVGKLTGGMAHDFNNLLTVILGNIELAEKMTEDPALIDCLKEARSATDRGADLIKNMLAFARKARLSPEVLDLNAVIRESQTWMTRTLPESISIEVSLLAGLWPIAADRSALETALLNLLLNAKDAVEGKGRLTIETSNVRIDEAYNASRGEDLEVGRYVMLAVSDSGHGIAADDLPRVFDPFFTTKDVGEGTGLGLSMVQGFMKQSGGSIRVYSEPGQGTTFKLYFPISGTPAGQAAAPLARREPDSAGATLLLVEDDENVRRVLARTLRLAGYTVQEAVNGDEGLKLYGDGSGYDLVVTDIVMPGELQGPALAKAIRKIRSDARIVFMSGYANEAQVHGNGLRPDDVRLTKPVQRAVLLEEIARCLARPPAGS